MIFVNQIVLHTKNNFQKKYKGAQPSGGELLKIRWLDNQLVNTFGRKSTARHKIYQLLESS
jgi:hypothetical protein